MIAYCLFRQHAKYQTTAKCGETYEEYVRLYKTIGRLQVTKPYD